MTLHMKSKNLILTAILMAVSSTVMAQENIQKAFDALRQSKGQEETYTNHFLERDPDTGLMEGMSDEYEFKIADKANKHLITAIRQAFDKDEQAAYSVSTGSHGGAENYISLAVGNGNKGVGIGGMKDSKWIYACFLDPEDTLRTHRYAYAMEWVEKKDGSITGRIIKTYATTQKFRQKKTSTSLMINGQKIDFSGAFGTLNSSLGGNESEAWITVLWVATNRRHGLANSIICERSSRRSQRALLPILGQHRSINSAKTKRPSRLMMLRRIWLKQRLKN